MALSKIEQLIQKYLDAKTNIEEEALLQAYFTQDNIPAHLQPYASMFGYFSKAKKQHSNTIFTPPVKHKRAIVLKKQLLPIAASILGMYFIADAFLQPKISAKQKQQATLAYAQTKQALTLLATHFNTGTQKMEYLQEFENTKTKLLK